MQDQQRWLQLLALRREVVDALDRWTRIDHTLDKSRRSQFTQPRAQCPTRGDGNRSFELVESQRTPHGKGYQDVGRPRSGNHLQTPPRLGIQAPVLATARPSSLRRDVSTPGRADAHPLQNDFDRATCFQRWQPRQGSAVDLQLSWPLTFIELTRSEVATRSAK